MVDELLAIIRDRTQWLTSLTRHGRKRLNPYRYVSVTTFNVLG